MRQARAGTHRFPSGRQELVGHAALTVCATVTPTTLEAKGRDESEHPADEQADLPELLGLLMYVEEEFASMLAAVAPAQPGPDLQLIGEPKGAPEGARSSPCVDHTSPATLADVLTLCLCPPEPSSGAAGFSPA